MRLFSGYDDVAGADCDANAISGICVAQRDFQLSLSTVELALHCALQFGGRSYRCVEDVLEAYDLRDRFVTRRREYELRHPLGEDASAFEHYHAFAERKRFFGGVGHVEDWNFVGRIPRAEVVEDFRFGRVVERGQRLVEQQCGGIRHQRSGEGCTLALAAGNLAGLARDQMRDAERLEHRHHSTAPFGGRNFHYAVLNVLRDRQMGEQREVLKHIAELTLRGRQVDAFVGVKQRSRTDSYAAGIGTDEASDAIQDGRLTAAGRPEQHREASWGLEAGLDREAVRGPMRDAHR